MVEASDKLTGKLQWSFRSKVAISAISLDGVYLYVGDMCGNFFRLDVQNGKIISKGYYFPRKVIVVVDNK